MVPLDLPSTSHLVKGDSHLGQSPALQLDFKFNFYSSIE